MVFPKILTCIFCTLLVIVPVSVTQSNVKPTLEEIKVTHKKIVEPVIVLDPQEVFCLAQNIYFEARGEDKEGQIAVAHVTLNRVNSEKFPNTVCEVVYQAQLSKWWLEQGKEVPIKHKCQFSWYCDGKSDGIKDWESFDLIAEMSRGVLSGKYTDNTNGAVYYHADHVTPDWSHSFKVAAVFNTHIFYTDVR